MQALEQWFLQASDLTWSWVVVPFVVLTALYFTIRLGAIQFRGLPHAIALLIRNKNDKGDKDGITSFQALSTALSGTTGIGNIAGVAVAIKLGGPGAVFWMWVAALLGMSIKYAEGLLGSLYRQEIGRGGHGEMGGGPMYYIVGGLGEKWRPLAMTYAILSAIACLGAWNMFQSNQASATMEVYFDIPRWLTGITLSFFVGIVLIGGIKRIARVAERLIPAMVIVYVGGVLLICLLNITEIPGVLMIILRDAFGLDAVGTGTAITALLYGMRRAVFSNEAGTGSAAIAHAAAHTRHPAEQGYIASLGPFIDTLVVCAATAFVIILAGFHDNGSYRNESANLIAQPASVTTIDANQRAVVRIPLGSGLDTAPADRIDAVRITAIHSGRGITASLVSDTGEVAASRLITSAELIESPNNFATLTLPRVLPTPLSRLTLELISESPGELSVNSVHLVSSLNGIALTAAAFASYSEIFGAIFIPIAALLFAYTTVLAGNYYGEISCHFISERFVRPYLWLYVLATFLGCVANLGLVINFSDLALGLMCIPNLIAIFMLSGKIRSQTIEYKSILSREE
jgi:AGCS family alanine or glycine:cation symporter